MKGVCLIHGEFIGSVIGCPMCLQIADEYEKEQKDDFKRKQGEQVTIL